MKLGGGAVDEKYRERTLWDPCSHPFRIAMMKNGKDSIERPSKTKSEICRVAYGNAAKPLCLIFGHK